MDRPVYSASSQFQDWGIPEFDRAVVLSQGFIPPELVEERLRESFAMIKRSQDWRYQGEGITKRLHIWSAQGRRVPMAEAIANLDYLTLARAAAAKP
jgi:hypothetical protein